MKLYWYGLIMLLRKFVLRQSTGRVLHDFATKMGVVYIKAAQIIAMQNYGDVFSEADRVALSCICDHCNPIPFSEIQQVLRQAYGPDWKRHFRSIDKQPLGSASISQVHRAVLHDGCVVAIKVKRQDVTRRIEHDVRQIKRLIHRFGRLTKFRNFLGSDRALELYVDWIWQETDFEQERRNLLRYQEFANSVNGRLRNTHTIQVPAVYSKLCTANVIVMEFIDTPTINQITLTDANKTRVATAINDYLSLSFYALLHNLPVVFHGDPHSGNIYLDRAGNIGFLDMGLIFEFSATEAEFIRTLFLNAYSGNVEEIVKIIMSDSQYTTYDSDQLLADIRTEAERFHDIPVTQFFVEMINVFTKYDIAPPMVLFKAAKAFVALFGINNFISNGVDTKSLLASQVQEYYLYRTVSDFRRIMQTGANLLPEFVAVSLQHGLASGLSAQLRNLERLNHEIGEACSHCREVVECLRAA